jgi:hypothetical protein
MTRTGLNLVIDALMAVLMATIAGLGFLINSVLIPGEQRPAVYGGRPDLYWLGWNRHQWGDLHLVLGIALLAIVVLHVVLHWSQVTGIWRRMVGSRVARVALAVLLLLLIVALMAFPALVTPQVVPGGDGHGTGHGTGRGRAALEGGDVGNRKPETGSNSDAANSPEGRGRDGEGRGLGRGKGRRRAADTPGPSSRNR